ncbi:MAG: ABC transporter ATP-binding protein/permease, partial [Chloroflexi bacterium]|nr:ABC transporter ATP-binding protein/permease [Chloroflexota bacterium]
MQQRAFMSLPAVAQQPVATLPVLRRLAGYLKIYRWQLIAVLGLVIAGAATNAGGPYLIGRAIDTAIRLGNGPLLDTIAVALVSIYAVSALATRFQVALMGSIGQRILARLRSEIFATLQSLSLRYFDQHPAGDLMSRLLNDTDVLNQLFGQGIVQVLGSLFGIVGAVIAMLLLDVRLAIVSLLVVPLMFFTTALFSQISRRAFQRTRESIGDVSAEIQEEIAGVRVAQAFNRTTLNRQRFAVRNAANRDANVSAIAITSALMPTLGILSSVAIAVVAGFGGYLALHHQATVGTVVAFITYVQQFFFPIQQLANFFTTIQAAFAAGDRIFSLIDSTPDLTDHPNAITMPPLRGEVVFDHVSFSYGSRRASGLPEAGGEPEPELDDIMLTAKPGETTAIVGPTGAGKTTLVSLIGRLYDVTSGAVRIDGVDVRDVTRASLRQQMGVVLQDSFLFSDTIAGN